LLFFLRGVTDQANDALTKARRLQDLQQRWQQAVRQTRSSTSLLRLIDKLFQSPILTIPEVERFLVVTARDAKWLMQKLVDAEILILSDNDRHRKTYVAIDIIRSVEED